MTCDTWHVTRYMWHVTSDTYTWHVFLFFFWGGGWTFSQNFSSLALTVCDLWYYEDLEEKATSVTQLINDEAVYKTAPATPGLLKTCWKSLLKIVHIVHIVLYICVFCSAIFTVIFASKKDIFPEYKVLGSWKPDFWVLAQTSSQGSWGHRLKCWPQYNSISCKLATFTFLQTPHNSLILDIWTGNRKIPHTGDKASLDRCGS